jgi:hypothetical protein
MVVNITQSDTVTAVNFLPVLKGPHPAAWNSTVRPKLPKR